MLCCSIFGYIVIYWIQYCSGLYYFVLYVLYYKQKRQLCLNPHHLCINSKLEGRRPRGTRRPHSSGPRKRQRFWARPSMSLSAGLTRTQARRHLGPGPRAQAAGVPVTRTLWARNPPLGRCVWSRTIRCILAEALRPRRCLTRRQPPPGSAQRPWQAT